MGSAVIISAKLYQFARCAFTLLLSGHHSTVPRPTTTVPIFVEPSLISMVKEFWLVRLVISTAAGRWATTVKFRSAIFHSLHDSGSPARGSSGRRCWCERSRISSVRRDSLPASFREFTKQRVSWVTGHWSDRNPPQIPLVYESEVLIAFAWRRRRAPA